MFFPFCSSIRSTGLRAVAVLMLVITASSMLGSSASAQPRAADTDTTTLTFDDAVRTALDQNTDLKRAQATVRRSETQVQAEWMDFAPDLNLSTDVTRRVGRNFSQVTGNFTTRSTDFFNVGGNSSVTLFNGYENISSLRQSRSQAEADELNLQRTRREVVFTVMDRYIALLESREIIRVRKEELEARRQQLRQIEEFVDAGSRPISDLYQEQANVAEAEQRLLQARREREVNKTRLIQTLQLDPRKPYHFEVPAMAADTLSEERYDVADLMDEAFRRRLDLRVAEAERQAADRGVTVARSSYYPTLTLSGRYGTDWTSRGRIPDPDNPGQFLNPSFSDQLDNNRGGGISLSLSIPVFQRFQRNTQVERAQVEALNAQYRLEDRRQQVALEVRQAYLDYRNAVQQLEAANKRLKAADQARAAAQERYNLGSASIVELQNATRDYVDAASQQVRARYNLIFRKKQIDYHVGRLRADEPLIGQQDAR